MNENKLSGLLLIVGPIVMMVAFISLGAGLGFGVDWADPSEMVPALGKNAGLVKTLIPVAILGMIMTAAGFSGLNNSMSGGSGAAYMKIGLLFFIMGTIVVVGESALTVALAEINSPYDSSSFSYANNSSFLLTVSGAFGSIGEAIHFLGFAIIGLAIYTQKNLHTVLSIFITAIGLIGVLVALVAYTSPIMMLTYLGMAILTLATGVLTNKTIE